MRKYDRGTDRIIRRSDARTAGRDVIHMLDEKEIMILSVKSYLGKLLDYCVLSDYEYGLACGYSGALFALGHISKLEYEDIKKDVNSKWKPGRSSVYGTKNEND